MNEIDFISIDDFKEYVEARSKTKPLSLDRCQKNQIFFPPTFDYRNCDTAYYCKEMHYVFRSRYEAMVARAMDSWGWDFRHEAFGFRFADGTQYVPDFYIETHDVFVEVKGEWRGSAKKKYLMAAELLGQEKIILLPKTLSGKFNSYVKRML